MSKQYTFWVQTENPEMEVWTPKKDGNKKDLIELMRKFKELPNGLFLKYKDFRVLPSGIRPD